MKHLKIIMVASAFSLAIASAFATNVYKAKVLVSQGFEAGNCAAGPQNVDGLVDCNANNITCRINGHVAYNSAEACNSQDAAGILKKQ